MQLFRNETKEWCTVSVLVNGKVEEIISTPGHKYYLPDNAENREVGEKQEQESYYGLSEKWVSASRLKNGDKVLLSNGNYGIIQSVKVEQLENPETTYNFEVEDFHTYYVGENSVCVHNECWTTQKKNYWKNEAKLLKGDGITYNSNKFDNLNRMKKGLAPFDNNKIPVELHHVKGRNFESIVQMTRTNHRGAGVGFHSIYGFKNFPDITSLTQWAGKFV